MDSSTKNACDCNYVELMIDKKMLEMERERLKEKLKELETKLNKERERETGKGILDDKNVRDNISILLEIIKKLEFKLDINNSTKDKQHTCACIDEINVVNESVLALKKNIDSLKKMISGAIIVKNKDETEDDRQLDPMDKKGVSLKETLKNP